MLKNVLTGLKFVLSVGSFFLCTGTKLNYLKESGNLFFIDSSIQFVRK